MSTNHYSSHMIMESAANSSSSNKTLISSHLLPNSAANASFWASNAATTATGAMLCSQTAAYSFNLNNEDEDHLVEEHHRESNPTSTEFEQEKLFEKPLTPSDVGKLNRLVIPKQHAEKYFPLNGGGGGDGEKGLLLGFEDEVGKSWRFRYSYWNSSQSYVLTKGWSRFVKEKRLDAGDIVLFARHPKDVGRLFIGWRRRNSGGGQESGYAQPPVGGGGGRRSGVVYPGHPYPSQHQLSSSMKYQADCPHIESQTRGKSGNSKRLRLFGVNLEYWSEDDSEGSTPTGSNMSGQTDQKPYHYQYYSNHHPMDMNI